MARLVPVNTGTTPSRLVPVGTTPKPTPQPIDRRVLFPTMSLVSDATKMRTEAQKQPGVVSSTLSAIPKVGIEGLKNYVQRQAERRATQTIGQQAVTELVKQPAQVLTKPPIALAKWTIAGMSGLGNALIESVGTYGLAALTKKDVGESNIAVRQMMENQGLGKLFKDIPPDDFAGMGDAISKGLNEMPNAKDWEKKFLPTVLPFLAISAELTPFGGKPARKAVTNVLEETIQRVAKETAEDAIRAMLKKAKLPDELIERAAPRLAKTTSTMEVRTILKRTADEVATEIQQRAMQETGQRVVRPTVARTTAQATEELPTAVRVAEVPQRKDFVPDEAIVENLRVAQQDDRALTRETIEYLSKSRLGVDKIQLPKASDEVVLWRTGDIEPGKIQSYSLEKKFNSQVPIVVKQSDLLADLGSDEFMRLIDNTYTGEVRGIYRDSVAKWADLEDELRVRSSATARPATPDEATSLAASRAKAPSGNPIDNALETYAKDAEKYKTGEVPKEVPARTSDGMKKMAGELLTPISSRLERINPALKRVLRRFENDVAQNTYRDGKKVANLMKVAKRMDSADAAVWDLARKNADTATIDALARKYGFEKELAETRQVLDDIYTRAKEVGMDVNYRQDYFPRMVKNPTEYMRYLSSDPNWSEVSALLEQAAKDKGIKVTDLTHEEMIGIFNNRLRGYGNKIELSTPSFGKQRTIETIDTELNRFYEDSDTALATYVIRMNDEIEARKFFGKGENIHDSIGSYVMKEAVEGRLNKADVPQVSEILKSRFARGKMNGALNAYRNVEYISTMGSPISAITQLGDLAFGAYKNGLYHTLKGMGKTVSRTGVTKEMLGVENVTEEFATRTGTAKALDTVFKATGLTALDRLGKETLINGTFSRLRTMAKKGDPQLYDELARSLEPEEIPQAIEDLQKGLLTDRTEVVLFNKLLDFQPVAKSEMPQKYLEHPNGRIFYMLKSFTLKQIDVFRREAIDGIVSGDPKKAAVGMKNLVRLSGMFMLANMGADQIKDWVLGRETSMEDRVVDNIWRLFGASKYDVYKARTEGVGRTLLGKILFPTSIFDRAIKDVDTMINDKSYKTGPIKGEQYKSELVQSIPLVGKPYYWWFGRGSQKELYNNSSQDDTGKVNLKGLPSSSLPTTKLPTTKLP